MSDLVLYMQIGETPYRQYIQENLNEIQRGFQRKNSQFVFLPALREKHSAAFGDQLQQYLEIYYPGYRLLSAEQQIQVLYIISSTSGEQSVYARIQDMFGFKLDEGAYLCYLNEKSSRIEKLPSDVPPQDGISKYLFDEKTVVYSVPPPDDFQRLNRVSNEIASSEDPISFLQERIESRHIVSKGQLSVKDDKIDLYGLEKWSIPQEKHEIDEDIIENHDVLIDDAIITPEIQRLLDTVKLLKLERGLNDLIGIILKNYAKELQLTNEQKGLQLTYGQFRRIGDPIESIRFNFEGQLFLGDKKVQMTPICRSVYRLFLNHHEGIELRNMGNYHEELHNIYRNIATHTDSETIISRVKLLCNPLDNSINEKISTINKAFKNLLGENYCMPYQILGVRGEAKIITVAGG